MEFGTTVALIKALGSPTDQQVQAAVDDYLDNHPTVTGTFTNEAKNALIALLEKVAYVDDDGQTYLDALTAELFAASVTSISAVFTQGANVIYDTDSLDTLRQYLVVTANYSDGTSGTVSTYTLSGSLTAGASTITATYQGESDTFNVTVTSTSLPAGYTKYDYIEKKTTSSTNATIDKFIVLNDQTDLNVLSLEAYLSQKSSGYNGAGIFGVRNDSAASNSFGIYNNTADNGVKAWIHGIEVFSNTYLIPGQKNKVVIKNSSTPPGYISVNDGTAASFTWSSSPVIPHGFCLFNSLPYNTTTQFAINPQCQIGTIILRNPNGGCVGYYIPAVYNDVIGMYDLVSEAFYTTATASAATINNTNCLYAVGNWT